MAQIIDRNIDDYHLGIWEITEDCDTLLSSVDITPEEQKIFNKFTCTPRKIEWLSVRALLRNMTGNNLKIVYNGNRKPFIHGNSYNISISHSNKYSSILLSKKFKVGIDLEYKSHRISKIAHKFINDQEKITSQKDMIRHHLYIHWCAKEALYKICDKQDINFKTNLFIEPFDPSVRKGLLKGWVKNNYRNEEFDLNYFTLNNYIIVYTVK